MRFRYLLSAKGITKTPAYRTGRLSPAEGAFAALQRILRRRAFLHRIGLGAPTDFVRHRFLNQI